jgi:hypothetical protein
MESEKNLDVPTRHGYLGATKATICVAKKHKEETMTKYTNAEIADNLGLWNEYFNVSALMTDDEFHAMSYDQRLQMLVEAFGADEYEDALDILCQFRGDLVPERSYAKSLTGTISNRATGMVLADDYIALLEGMDDGVEDRVTVTPIPAGEALAIWREACDADGVSYDAPDVDEWIRIRVRERDATEMTPGVVTELIVPVRGWY